MKGPTKSLGIVTPLAHIFLSFLIFLGIFSPVPFIAPVSAYSDPQDNPNFFPPQLKRALDKAVERGYRIYVEDGDHTYSLGYEEFFRVTHDFLHEEDPPSIEGMGTYPDAAKALSVIQIALSKNLKVYLKKGDFIYKIGRDKRLVKLETAFTASTAPEEVEQIDFGAKKERISPRSKAYPDPRMAAKGRAGNRSETRAPTPTVDYGYENRIGFLANKNLAWKRLRLSLISITAESKTFFTFNLGLSPSYFFNDDFALSLHLGGHLQELNKTLFFTIDGNASFSYHRTINKVPMFFALSAGMENWTALGEHNLKFGFTTGVWYQKRRLFMDQMYLSFYQIPRDRGDATQIQAGLSIRF